MGLVFQAAAGLVGLAVVLGAFLYVTDYGVEATITQKGQDGQGRFVVATTKVGGLQQKQYLPVEQWALVQEGFFVVYHIQSSKIEVYDKQGGRLIYRS